jgi:hypothetical protein
VYEVHVAFSGNPQRALEAPVTEIDLSTVDDREVNPDARPAAETQELVRQITYRIESLQMQGFIALSWGVALEDGTRGVYLGGWKTIEVRSFARSLLLSLVLSFRYTFSSFDRTTCVWAHWMNTKFLWKRLKRYSKA